MKAVLVFQVLVGFGFFARLRAEPWKPPGRSLSSFVETSKNKSNASVSFIVEFIDTVDFDLAIREFHLPAADTQVSNQSEVVLQNEIPFFKVIVVDAPSEQELEYWLSNRTGVKSYFENEATGVIVDTEEGS